MQGSPSLSSLINLFYFFSIAPSHCPEPDLEAGALGPFSCLTAVISDGPLLATPAINYSPLHSHYNQEGDAAAVPSRAPGAEPAAPKAVLCWMGISLWREDCPGAGKLGRMSSGALPGVPIAGCPSEGAHPGVHIEGYSSGGTHPVVPIQEYP